MKHIIDEIQPWNIPTLLDDIERLTREMRDYTVWVWRGKGDAGTLLSNPTGTEIERALAEGVHTVIVKRLRPEPGEPSPELFQSGLTTAGAGMLDPSRPTARAEK